MKFAVGMSSSEDLKTSGDNMNSLAVAEPASNTNGTEQSSSNASPKGNSSASKGQEKEENPFSDYLWMENMEEYDQEIMRQLEEDILISHYTDMYEDSLLEDGSPGPTTASLCVVNGPIHPNMGNVSSSDDLDDVSRQFNRSMNFSSSSSSRLNPNAAEFVPKTFGNVSYQH